MPTDPAPKRVSRARPMVGVRLHADTIATIDALAKRRKMSRAAWLRLAVERVVKAETDRATPETP